MSKISLSLLLLTINCPLAVASGGSLICSNAGRDIVFKTSQDQVEEVVTISAHDPDEAASKQKFAVGEMVKVERKELNLVGPFITE